MSPKDNSREVILDAAEEVVFEVGAGNLTLQAVAEKAVGGASNSRRILSQSRPRYEHLVKRSIRRPEVFSVSIVNNHPSIGKSGWEIRVIHPSARVTVK